MRFSIAGKIISMTVAAVLFSCCLILVLVVQLFAPPLEASLDGTIRVVKGMVSERYKADEAKFLAEAGLVAGHPGLVAAVVSNDHVSAKKIGTELMTLTGSEFITITDAKGIPFLTVEGA